MDGFHTGLFGDLVGRNKGLVDVQAYPRMALGDLAPNDHAVIDRIDAGGVVELHAFGMGVGKQGLEVGVVVEIQCRPVDQVVGPREVAQRPVEFPLQQHLTHIGVVGNVVQRHIGRRRKAGRRAMAVVVVALHPEFHVARMDVVFVLQIAARPKRRRLLVFRHPHLLADQVLGHLYAAVLAYQHADIEHPARGEDRQADPARVAAGDGDQHSRHRHLRQVEIGEAQLAPKQLRRVDLRIDQGNSIGLDLALDERPRPRVVRDGEAELQIHTVS